MAHEMKHSGISWIDDMPSHWTITRFKYCFTTGTGLNITKADLIDDGVAVISYGQIHAKYNSRTHLSDNLLRYIPESLTIGRGRSKLSRNDFVFADTSEDLEGCGNAAFIDTDKLVYAGYHTVIAHPYVDGDFRFLAYLFSTQQWRTQIQQRVSGVKVNSITRSLLNDSLLIVPPIPEQTAIADFLDTKCAEIDGLLEDLDAEVKTLAEYKKSIIAETVIHGLNPNASLVPTNLGWIDAIPKHWGLEKFRYKLKPRRISGQIDKQVLSVYREFGVIPKDSRDDNHNRTSDDTSNYKYVRPNDFVINKMKAWQGSMGVSQYEGIVSPAYFVYEFSDDSYNPRYFHYFMRNANNIPEYRRLSGGIREGQWDLSPYNLGNMPIVVPPKTEQNEIVNYLDEKCKLIEASITEKLLQIEKLKEYKASLIYEYVTGKRQVI
jgi:type I restriction enzyme S subunit